MEEKTLSLAECRNFAHRANPPDSRTLPSKPQLSLTYAGENPNVHSALPISPFPPFLFPWEFGACFFFVAEAREVNRDFLERLARATGGRAFFPVNVRRSLRGFLFGFAPRLI